MISCDWSCWWQGNAAINWLRGWKNWPCSFIDLFIYLFFVWWSSWLLDWQSDQLTWGHWWHWTAQFARQGHPSDCALHKESLPSWRPQLVQPTNISWGWDFAFLRRPFNLIHITKLLVTSAKIVISCVSISFFLFAKQNQQNQFQYNCNLKVLHYAMLRLFAVMNGLYIFLFYYLQNSVIVRIKNNSDTLKSQVALTKEWRYM